MITQISAAEAAEIMRARGCRITPEAVREGLMDRRFPFGECFISKSGVARCSVYKKLLEQWLAERDDDME